MPKTAFLGLNQSRLRLLINPGILFHIISDFFIEFTSASGQKLTIHLLYEEKIPIHFLEVDVQGDHVILMGTVEVQGLIEQAGVVASQYPGIRSVDNKIVFVSSYPPMA